MELINEPLLGQNQNINFFYGHGSILGWLNIKTKQDTNKPRFIEFLIKTYTNSNMASVYYKKNQYWRWPVSCAWSWIPSKCCSSIQLAGWRHLRGLRAWIFSKYFIRAPSAIVQQVWWWRWKSLKTK